MISREDVLYKALFSHIDSLKLDLYKSGLSWYDDEARGIREEWEVAKSLLDKLESGMVVKLVEVEE